MFFKKHIFRGLLPPCQKKVKDFIKSFKITEAVFKAKVVIILGQVKEPNPYLGLPTLGLQGVHIQHAEPQVGLKWKLHGSVFSLIVSNLK